MKKISFVKVNESSILYQLCFDIIVKGNNDFFSLFGFQK
ncbi:hypothetical protein SAMN04489761_4095 [Tenacibaculum sp. MAR_2009_124]|nr:hypothetical protein SAMN04489761_4095 [Tenacibaculum sp. MAR_2009_124]